MRTLIRWLLVPAAALGVWYAGMALALVALGVLGALCPEELIVSGLCTASWYGPAVDSLVILTAGVVAFGMILATTAVAPSHQPLVAVITFVCGAAFATFVVSTSFDGMLGPFASAATGGTAALVILRRRMRRPQSTSPDARTA